MSNQDVEQGRAIKNEGNNNDPNNNSSIAPFYIETSEKQWTPWLVPMFVVANVAMFVLAMYLNNCPNKNLGSQEKCIPSLLGRFSFQPSKENPLYGPSSSTLEKLGALNWDKVVHRHQGWRLFSCFWLHAGIIHLVVNMLSLVLIGIRLEQQFGFVRVGIMYLLAGMGGSILSSLFIQNYITVGASGALFGLLGAMLSELLTNWSNYTSKGATLFTLIVVIVINAVVGILPRVNNFAHIGGFLTGFLLGFVLLLRPQFKWIERHRLPPEGAAYVSKHKIYQYILLFASLILLISGFTFGLVMLFKGERGNKHCSWCHYLSCVPTSKWDCGN